MVSISFQPPDPSTTFISTTKITQNDTPPAEFKSTIAITHVTTATAMLEIDGVKFITDPIFDDAPRDYDLSHLAGMKPGEVILSVTDGPKVGIEQLPVIDCVLLSHEDHVDNLDETGRQLLIGRQVITTPDGAKNLSEYPGVSAIKPWQTLKFRIGGEEWAVTGVPCVHVPGGEVTGILLHKKSFGVSSDGRPNVFYFTGDTVLVEDEFKKIREQYHVVVALVNLGQAMSPNPESPTGFTQITMGGTDAVRMCEILEPDVLVPMHFESWTHFTQDGEALREVFNTGGILDKAKWLTSGTKVQII
jgi:L-ascorbate metabolism protein UlaG (beta-lactamase superfamily)